MCVCPTCRVGCEHTDCVSRPPGSQPRSPRAREARVLLFPHLPPPPPCWRGRVWPRRPPFALADAPELAVVRGSPWGGGAGRAGGLRGRLLPQVQHAEPPGQRGLRLRVDRSAQGGEQGGTRPLEGSGLGPPHPWRAARGPAPGLLLADAGVCQSCVSEPTRRASAPRSSCCERRFGGPLAVVQVNGRPSAPVTAVSPFLFGSHLALPSLLSPGRTRRARWSDRYATLRPRPCALPWPRLFPDGYLLFEDIPFYFPLIFFVKSKC